MAFQHGKDTVIQVGSDDISAFTSQSELTKGADDHDTTPYGQDGHTFEGGLTTGTFTASGTYDNTATTGTRAILEPLVGTKVQVTRQPEGAGSGLPQDVFTLLVTSYVETNPAAEMITWSLEGTVSGSVDTTAQI